MTMQTPRPLTPAKLGRYVAEVAKVAPKAELIIAPDGSVRVLIGEERKQLSELEAWKLKREAR